MNKSVVKILKHFTEYLVMRSVLNTGQNMVLKVLPVCPTSLISSVSHLLLFYKTFRYFCQYIRTGFKDWKFSEPLVQFFAPSRSPPLFGFLRSLFFSYKKDFYLFSTDNIMAESKLVKIRWPIYLNLSNSN